MTASSIRLNDIYDRTTGRCHLCGKRLAFHNYGCHGTRGAWHIEHSVPRANGGTDHLNNLYPGCIPCNLSKGTRSTRSVRAWHGRKRAPLSRAKREEAQTESALLGMLVGSLVGASFWGLKGAIWGGLAGACLGGAINPT